MNYPYLTSRQLYQMMLMQNDLNTVTSGSFWTASDNNYMLALKLELAELLEHMNWAWWRKGQPNIEEARTELIDCMHFWLSHQGVSRGKISLDMFDYVGENDIPPFNDSTDLTTIVSFCLSTPIVMLHDLLLIAGKLDMRADVIINRFCAKMALNFFRQENGYKSGTYKKIWSGREDNTYLEAAVNNVFTHVLTPDQPNDPAVIMPLIKAELAEMYAEFA